MKFAAKSLTIGIAAATLAGLVLFSAAAGGVYWLQPGQPSGPNGTGERIVAPKANDKEKPAEATAVLAVPPAGPVTAKPATPTATNKEPTNAVFVQLGAFGDSAKAETAWTGLNKRFGFLAGMNRKIAQANVEGGGTVFRLQAITANSTEAQQLCAKLKAAGENCLIVR
ncbi:MAG: hypothetical protein HEQ34_06870 [Sphingorhabdus sp.]|uniref:SPOR domain-containing protein n=1 Tax=Sphingorhabdus sp. TaxID=1902408 RepID=UPI0025ECAAFA|nr:SPOR domain-containing protein [Sphingorhabdus sp.]MCO4091660.1 hypothetical protein [Sphingorhabdus sp.]